MRRSSRTTEDSSSGRIMRLVPKFVQTDNASSSIKTANVGVKNPGGGESYMEQTGMLVGNFELNL